MIAFGVICLVLAAFFAWLAWGRFINRRTGQPWRLPVWVRVLLSVPSAFFVLVGLASFFAPPAPSTPTAVTPAPVVASAPSPQPAPPASASPVVPAPAQAPAPKPAPQPTPQPEKAAQPARPAFPNTAVGRVQQVFNLEDISQPDQVVWTDTRTLKVVKNIEVSYDERGLMQSAYTYLAQSSRALFKRFPQLQTYRVVVTTEFTSEDIYGNQKARILPAVTMGVSRETESRANWDVLRDRCKRFAVILDEHTLHPSFYQPWEEGSSGCWASN